MKNRDSNGLQPPASPPIGESIGVPFGVGLRVCRFTDRPRRSNCTPGAALTDFSKPWGPPTRDSCMRIQRRQTECQYTDLTRKTRIATGTTSLRRAQRGGQDGERAK